ncbi:putative ubiquitin-conjugating enzyme [Aspergillus steynii IBT 23096]|uniref:Putative ubiquitin-conjugating enzyme n=1 Tax=Aspergillus steynii IBT 23096 TaxID=1392250 RepID=A0A2I2GJX3_9EURO|nr:putative ubiquitin-conjugating enzyme [Aspergillus steynii IBT 23096]PLB53184.1 putative ubiquitin-conjugating enzyme [Aspergillus steynii IBT 23096]
MGSTNNSVKFHLTDLVQVKGKSRLLGTVSLTHDDIDDDDIPVGELFILSHTAVPSEDLLDFLRTKRPPFGYVFVHFKDPSYGYSLVHEGDLELLDRLFVIGQPVKRDLLSPISGTIISMSMKCSVVQIAHQPVNPRTGDYGPLQFLEAPRGRAVWPSTRDGDPPQIHDVPISELIHFEPFSEDDYIIYRQKLGKIRSVERDAVMLLSNQKVASVNDIDRVEIPLFNDPQNVVGMPDNLDQIHTHPLPDGRYVWSDEARPAVPGQYVLTSANNMSRHDLESGTNVAVEPEGYVLATPATGYTIDWVCPNVFAVGVPFSSPTSERYTAATIHEQAVKCDFGQLPKDALSNEKAVRTDLWHHVGSSVRFRDPADACRKYPKYQHIPTDESFGYDLNILRTMRTKTEVTVQWQDGSITTEDSTCLHAFDQAEEEVWPGNLVVLIDGMESIREPLSRRAIPLHITESEITVESFRLKNIGVVQTVDGRERVASVRWYENPNVVLTHDGEMIKPGSSLGVLGSAVTEVSFYEIVRYSCLELSLGDRVLLVPDTVHEATLPQSSLDPIPQDAGPCQMSFLAPSTFFETLLYLEAMKMSIVGTEWFKNSITIDKSPVPSRFSLRYTEFNVNTPANFFGQVVAMDIDGTITVRLAATNNCRDIRISLERLMLLIDEDGIEHFPSLDLFAPSWATSTTPLNQRSVLDELSWNFDNPPTDHRDSNGMEDDWFTASDTETDENVVIDDPDEDNEGYHEIRELNGNRFEAAAVSDIPPPEPETDDSEDFALTETSSVQGGSTTSSSSAADCPPSFALLEGPPPSDHHFLGREQNCRSGPLAKRIHKEYEILRSSLPSGIFVRAWESRIDLMRVLIIGPQGTPYEYAPFVFDLYFSKDFPNSPPLGFFHSWTYSAGKVNPNLYEDGTICLSILGTWTAQNPEEGWSAAKSTVLQVLVSLLGLVLVKTPFYNEAGYEAFAEEGNKQLESALYTEKAFLLARMFIEHALEESVGGLEDVLTWHYLPSTRAGDERPRLLRRAIDTALEMIDHHNRTAAGDDLDETNVASAFVKRLSLGAVVMLRKHITAFERIEAKNTRTGS